MLLLLIGSLVGIVLGLSIDFYLLIALYFLSILLCFIYYFIKGKLNQKFPMNQIILFFIFVLIFFAYTKVQIHQYDTKYQAGNIEDNFEIISYADEGNYYDKYIGKNSQGDKFLLYLSNKNGFKKGDIIEASGEFVLPNLARNKGAFNYRRYLNSQKIYGSIFVKDFYLTDIGKFNLIYFIQDEIYQSFAKLFPKNEMGLILGMMIGETKDISEDTLTSFKNTGITHLIAVSGSNVMYVLLCVQFLFQKICGKRKSYWISIFVLILFMLVSGTSSSVVRATIMTTLMILANIFYQKSDTIHNIAISALVLMIISPLIVYDVGFILSFGGTLGIVLLSKDFENFFKKKLKKFSMLSETLATTCSAQLVLLPIMAYYFNTFSVIAIFTNLMVVPISGLITILGFAIFMISKLFFPLASFLSKPLYILAHFTILISQLCSKIPFSNVKVMTPNLFEIILFYYIVFFLTGKINLPFVKENGKLMRKNDRKKYHFVFILISIFLMIEIIIYHFPRNFIEVNCIDVGQGDAFFVETNHHQKILIDGGGSKTYDVGENILIPYLLDRRVLAIDCIFSSHSDADHVNGILTAVKELKVGKVYIAKNALGYEELYQIAKKRNTKIMELQLGDEIQIDHVIFQVVGPAKTVDEKDVNAYSLVLKMKYQSKSMLFTGDINQEAELKLQNVKADILKVAHHGSSTSSALKFIAKVKPKISVISVGQNNQYGHPSKEVIARLQKYSKVYTTAEQGEIKIKIYKDRIKVE